MQCSKLPIYQSLLTTLFTKDRKISLEVVFSFADKKNCIEVKELTGFHADHPIQVQLRSALQQANLALLYLDRCLTSIQLRYLVNYLSEELNVLFFI